MANSIFPSLWGDKGKGENPLATLHREIDRVFDDVARGDHWPFRVLAGTNGKMMPRMDVSETEKEIEITADLPGVDESDVEIKLSNDMLTIKGEKKSEVEKSEKDFHLVERSYGLFERTTRLPCEVEADKVRAVFKQGVLKITLPKSHSAKANERKIEITTK